jgi:hypothetical protein
MASEPPAGKLKFGEWLPDQNDLDNPGVIEALNVLPIGTTQNGYQPYAPLATAGAALTTTGQFYYIVALLAIPSTGTVPYVYAGTFDGHLYQSPATAGAWTDYSPALSAQIYDLVQYNTLVIASVSSGGLYQQTVGAGVNFAAISGSPNALYLGVIGQFLVGGNIAGTPNVVQWSGIGQPTSWPTPGSATAIAQQSGQQTLHLELGGVTGIFGGDQWGIITQQNAITRVTYVGGSTVFQFDTLSSGVGMDYAHAGVKIGNEVLFASSKGFYATDGVTAVPIGQEKVNRWFISNVVSQGISTGRVAVDWSNKLVYWAFPTAGASPVVIYNYETKRFTHASDSNIGPFVQSTTPFYFTTYGLQAIGQDKKLGTFTGTPGTATITTGEVELNPGGKALVQGFRPQVTGAGAVTCKIGSRMKQSDSVSFTSALTPNSVSGFADALVEASYHRAETDIVGSFGQAIGGEFLHSESGAF